MKLSTILLVGVAISSLYGCDSSSSNKKKPKSNSNPIPNSGLPLSQQDLNDVKSVWVGRLHFPSQRKCSVVYDFRNFAEVGLHILCPAADRKSILIESSRLSITGLDSRQFNLNPLKTACSSAPQQQKNINYFMSSIQQNNLERKTMSLMQGQEGFIYLLQVPDSAVSVDYFTAQELHSLPVQHGCFTNAEFTTFQRQG